MNLKRLCDVIWYKVYQISCHLDKLKILTMKPTRFCSSLTQVPIYDFIIMYKISGNYVET